MFSSYNFSILQEHPPYTTASASLRRRRRSLQSGYGSISPHKDLEMVVFHGKSCHSSTDA
jgi:hypothetical protein